MTKVDGLRRLLSEPLLHFLLAAAGLFIVYGFLSSDDDGASPTEIVVTRDDLLIYMQYRSRAFDAEQVNAAYEKLSPQERNQLIDDYARQEAMYREAKALNLDKNDYVAKLRLIQQLEFITQGFIDAATELTLTSIEAHFEAHQADYVEPAKITFTHVFFSNDRRGAADAHGLAEKELRALNERRTPFHEAMRHGDRALYHVNYVQKEKDLVASHFGDEMADTLFELSPDDAAWRGVFRSPHGAHLVLVTEHVEEYHPKLEEVRDRVEADALRALQDQRLEEAVDAIVALYRIRVSDDILEERAGASS